MEQRKPCVVQCLKNLISSSIYSTKSFRQLSPPLRWHTHVPFFYPEHPLLKLLTGSFIFFLLLNQLSRSWLFYSAPSVFFLPICWLCAGAFISPVWSTHLTSFFYIKRVLTNEKLKYVKKSHLSLDPVKKTVGEKKQGMEVQLRDERVKILVNSYIRKRDRIRMRGNRKSCAARPREGWRHTVSNSEE